MNFGASDLTRTGDLLITSEMHYRLCYTSIVSAFLLYPLMAELSTVFVVVPNEQIRQKQDAP